MNYSMNIYPWLKDVAIIKKVGAYFQLDFDVSCPRVRREIKKVPMMYYIREAAKKVIFFSGPTTKALPSPSSLVVTFFRIFFRA